MSLMTNWGYDLKDVSVLADILSQSEFNSATANKFSGDGRTADSLKSASQSVRDFCGWHIYPEMACVLESSLYSLSIVSVADGFLVQLPAKLVSRINSVKIDEIAKNDFILERNGLLRIFDVCGVSKKAKIEIEYVAGIPEGLAGAVKSVVVNRAIKFLTSNNGVQSETAGGVSISYNSAWVNDSNLNDSEKAALSSYVVKGVF